MPSASATYFFHKGVQISIFLIVLCPAQNSLYLFNGWGQVRLVHHSDDKHKCLTIILVACMSDSIPGIRVGQTWMGDLKRLLKLSTDGAITTSPGGGREDCSKLPQHARRKRSSLCWVFILIQAVSDWVGSRGYFYCLGICRGWSCTLVSAYVPELEGSVLPFCLDNPCLLCWEWVPWHGFKYSYSSCKVSGGAAAIQSDHITGLDVTGLLTVCLWKKWV